MKKRMKYKLPKVPTKNILLEYGSIIVGAFIVAAGFVFFINPYKFVPGGVYSIGIVVHHFFPAIAVGTVGLVIDVPLVLIGIRILGPKFGAKTLVGMVLTPIFMNTLTYFIGEDNPLGLADELLLSCIFGGITLGIGLGLIFRARATSGGSDIIAMIIGKFNNMPVGQILIIVDSIIVLIGLVVFKDWKIPLYSWLIIYITGQVIDIILKGFSADNALFIISEKHEEIRQVLMYNLERGGTYLKGEGMYTGEQKNVIFVVVSRRELPILKSMIHRIDERAFVSVISTSETMGEGFLPLKQQD